MGRDTEMAVSWRLSAGVQLNPTWQLGFALRRVLGFASDDGYGLEHDTHSVTMVAELHPLTPGLVDPYVFGEFGYGQYRFTSERSEDLTFRTVGLVGGGGLGCLFRGRHLGIGPQGAAQLGPENFAYSVELRLDFRP